MQTDRRTMTAMIAAGAGALLVTPASAAATPEAHAGALVHHVFFWLKRPGSSEDRQALIAGLRTLRAIPVIRDLQIGIPASTERRDVVDASFDVSELMVFANAADQKVYQDHPIHHAFVKACEHLWQRVVVYDMQIVPPPA